MFNRRKQQRTMEMIGSYQPTSKSSLKQFCIMTAKGDVDEAAKLYNFMIKDMEELPVFDPAPKNWVDNTKEAVGGFMDFFKQNKDGFAQVYDVIRGIAAARGKNLPPLGGNVAESVSEALTNIN